MGIFPQYISNFHTSVYSTRSSNRILGATRSIRTEFGKRLSSTMHQLLEWTPKHSKYWDTSISHNFKKSAQISPYRTMPLLLIIILIAYMFTLRCVVSSDLLLTVSQCFNLGFMWDLSSRCPLSLVYLLYCLLVFNMSVRLILLYLNVLFFWYTWLYFHCWLNLKFVFL